MKSCSSVVKSMSKEFSKVIPFLQNASYYFQKGNLYYQQNKLEKALLFFKKTIEVEPDNSLHHYNLACLFSRMGYLEKANKIFSYIVHQLDSSLTECYFLMAVNYGLMDELEKARHYLNLYLQVSPDGEMAMDAEDLLFTLSEDAEEEDLQVKDEVLEEAVALICQQDERDIIERYPTSKTLRRLLRHALYLDDSIIAERTLYLFSLMGDAGAEMLKEFVKNPWVKQRLRLQALLKLKNMGLEGVLIVFLEEDWMEIDLSSYPLKAPYWLDEWQEVLNCTLDKMRQSEAYDELFFEDAQAIWIDFLNNIYPQKPGIRKRESWGAALEYALSRYHFLNLTQKELTARYNVSLGSISSRYQDFNRALNLEHRAYHNMLRYLTKRD